MKRIEVQELIEKAGGSMSEFDDWMTGQTVGIDDNGETDYYDYDVRRFIRYSCDPKNEPLSEFD